MRLATWLAIVLGLGAAAVSVSPVAASAAPADAASEQARKACFEGRWMLVQNRLDEAIPRLELALSLSPNYAEAKDLMAQAQARRAATDKHCDTAVALAGQGKWTEAVQEVQWAIQVYPGSAKAKGLLQDVRRQAAEAALKSGLTLAATGNLAAAEAELRRSLEYVFDQVPAREALARIDAQRGRAAAELGRPGAEYLWFAEAAELAPNNVLYPAQQAVARAIMVGRLRFAVVQNPPSAGAAMGDFSDAAWKRMVAIKPDFLDVTPDAAGAAAMAVAIDAEPVDIRIGLPKVEARTMSYKTIVQEPNPNFVALGDRLTAARANLVKLRIADQQYYYEEGEGSPDLLFQISMTQYNIGLIQNAMARTPAVLAGPAMATWPYSIETTEKLGTLEAAVQVTNPATGQPVTAEAVHCTRRFASVTIRNANPDIGLRDTSRPMPTDDEVRRAVLAAGTDEAAAKALAVVLGIRAAGLQAGSQKFLVEGKLVPAVEMGADAALVREAFDKAEASRLQIFLRERLRIEEKNFAPPK